MIQLTHPPIYPFNSPKNQKLGKARINLYTIPTFQKHVNKAAMVDRESKHKTTIFKDVFGSRVHGVILPLINPQKQQQPT